MKPQYLRKFLMGSVCLIIAVTFLLTTCVAQNKKQSFQYNTVENTSGKTTLGIGIILDTPSHISCQYHFYELLTNNPIPINGNEIIYPIITNKRAQTTFYLEGIYSAASINLTVWKQGAIMQHIKLVPGKPVNEAPGEDDIKQMYAELSTALSGQPFNDKVKLRDMDIFEPTDKLVDKDASGIGGFIYGSAINYTPQINFKKELYNLYTNGRLETEYLELKDFKGDKFKFKTFEDYVDKNYVGLASLYQTPSFFPKDPMKAAESVHWLYKTRKSDNFFFTSKFVDDKAKIACRKVVFPLWKRPGTALTYCLAAQDFSNSGYGDQALQAYYSSLVMADILNAYPSFIHFLKGRIYQGLAQNYGNENNTAYASLARELGLLHQSMQSSGIVKKRSSEFEKLSNDVSSYFSKIEQTAIGARTQKRAALWSTLGGIALATTSAVNDGLNGLTTLSPETQGLLNAATETMTATGDYKLNSLSASAEAAQAFTNVYGDIVKQFQNSASDMGIVEPIMSKDFIRLLGDKELVQENREHIIAFSEKFPLLKMPVSDYLNAATDAEKINLLQAVYRKMATVEMQLYVKESMGDKTGIDIFNLP